MSSSKGGRGESGRGWYYLACLAIAIAKEGGTS